jgi:hypothetical protein
MAAKAFAQSSRRAKNVVMKYFSVAMLFLFSPASAEDCRKYPPGPFRFQCASAKNPGLIAKRERCKQLATERGFKFGVQNKGAILPKHFIQGCMQGTQR